MNDGGPAFPRQHAVADANDAAFKLGNDGMSLRDYFAANVCDIVISKFVKRYWQVCEINEPETWGENELTYSLMHMERVAKIEARYRYALADAMLARRAKEKGNVE